VKQGTFRAFFPRDGNVFRFMVTRNGWDKGKANLGEAKKRPLHKKWKRLDET